MSYNVQLFKLIMLQFFRILSVLFFFLGFLYYFLKKKKCWKGLIKAAPGMGLTFYKSDVYSNFGEIRGVYKGHKSRLKIELGGHTPVLITMKLNCASTNIIDIQNAAPVSYPDKRWTDINPEHKSFCRSFKTRRVINALRERFESDIDLIDHMANLRLRWMLSLSRIKFGSGEISCTMNDPFGFPYIEPEKFARFLEELNELANHLEKVLSVDSACFQEKPVMPGVLQEEIEVDSVDSV